MEPVAGDCRILDGGGVVALHRRRFEVGGAGGRGSRGHRRLRQTPRRRPGARSTRRPSWPSPITAGSPTPTTSSATSRRRRQELLGADHRIVNSGHHSKTFMRELWRRSRRGACGEGQDSAIGPRMDRRHRSDTTIVPFLDARGRPRQHPAIRSDVTLAPSAGSRLREQAALMHLHQLAAVVAHEVREPPGRAARIPPGPDVAVSRWHELVQRPDDDDRAD